MIWILKSHTKQQSRSKWINSVRFFGQLFSRNSLPRRCRRTMKLFKRAFERNLPVNETSRSKPREWSKAIPMRLTCTFRAIVRATMHNDPIKSDSKRPSLESWKWNFHSMKSLRFLISHAVDNKLPSSTQLLHRPFCAAIRDAFLREIIQIYDIKTFFVATRWKIENFPSEINNSQLRTEA